jgi:hypothetical protein
MQVTREQRPVGRHRARRLPVRPAVRVGVVAAFVVTAGFTAATWPGAAVADAPIQTGWWNAMSGGGEAAPAPTTPEGGLRVAVSPGEVLAYGAVQYLFPAGSGGTLELKVASATGFPAINPNAPSTDPKYPVMACPTKDAWEAGDNQDIESAPAYDCSKRSFVGSFSADGKTATFLVDDGGQKVPGQLSLAVIPITTNDAPAGLGTELPVDVTSPTVVDFAKPDAGSLTVTAPYQPPPVDGGTGSGTGTGTGGGTTTGTGGTTPGSTGGGGYTAPDVPIGGLPGGSTTTGGELPPVVAPDQPGTVGTGVPVAAAAPAAENDTAHNVALALLLLLGLLIAATNSNHAPRAPRLLGGAGRHAAGTAAVAGAGAAAGAGATGAGTAAVPMTLYGSRGLGRFNKPRTTPPRPLI